MLGRFVFVPVLAAACFSGCAWTPGNYLDTSNVVQTGPQDPNRKIEVQRITPQLVAMQNRDLAEQAAALDAALKAQSDVPADFRYFVAPQDILGITVWNHPELSLAGGDSLGSTMGVPNTSTAGSQQSMPYVPSSGGTSLSDPLGYTVGPNGNVFFPFAGSVHVAGKTVEDIRVLLAAALGKYIRNPQVSVRVLSYRSQQVQLTGEIKNPGTLAITDHPLTLVEAISRAGGTTADADIQEVRLTRGGKLSVVNAYDLLYKGDTSQNVLLKSGDIVNVPDRLDSRIFVLGEVMRPSTLFMNRGRLTLADAITGASGVDNTAANVRQVYVVRGANGDPNDPRIFQLDMSKPDSLLLASTFQLHPMDVVYVGTAAGASFNRVLNLITPTLTTLFYTRQLTR